MSKQAAEEKKAADIAKYGIEYKGEIYGRIWESIAWSKEEAAAQHLSNLLFMAAKEDIIADKNADNKNVEYGTRTINFTEDRLKRYYRRIVVRGGKEFSNQEMEDAFKYLGEKYKLDAEKFEDIREKASIEQRDEGALISKGDKGFRKKMERIYGLVDDDYDYHIGGSSNNLDKVLEKMETDPTTREVLKGKLTRDYGELKKTLSDVRVLGVGNSTLEKVGKACKIICKTICTMVGPAMIAIAAAITPLAIFAVPPSVVVLRGVSEASINLAGSRAGLKESLKENSYVQKELKRRSETSNAQGSKGK